MSIQHYENFPVASPLLPPALRAPVRVIYAFARSADDLADEGDAPAIERIAALDAYEAELDRIDAGEAPATEFSASWRARSRLISWILSRSGICYPPSGRT